MKNSVDSSFDLFPAECSSALKGLLSMGDWIAAQQKKDNIIKHNIKGQDDSTNSWRSALAERWNCGKLVVSRCYPAKASPR